MPETFTEGMSLEVDGLSPFNDYYMEAVSPAMTIFESPEPGYGCAVAYDEGTYKTIGTSFEFGYLVDGEPPSTKKDLLMKYLEFFGALATGINEDQSSTVTSISAYPNPSKGNTNIRFTLQERTSVRLDIYSLNGQKVNAMIDETLESGNHQLSWDGCDKGGVKLPAGIYVCRLISDRSITTYKIVLID
jgi:hypothetical protein